MGHDINQHTHPPSPLSPSPLFLPSIQSSCSLWPASIPLSTAASHHSVLLYLSIHHLCSVSISLQRIRHQSPNTPDQMLHILHLYLSFLSFSAHMVLPSFHLSSSYPTPSPPFSPQVRTIGWFRFIRREHPTSDETAGQCKCPALVTLTMSKWTTILTWLRRCCHVKSISDDLNESR